MKVKVIKASLGSYWYADRVGEVFDVTANGHGNSNTFPYKLVSNENWGSYFDKDDVEIIEEKKQMKKSDLKSGMRVVHGKHPRQSGFAIVVKDLDQFVFKDGGWNYIASYNEDLKNGSVWDITAIYAAPERDIFNFNISGDLLWQRGG